MEYLKIKSFYEQVLKRNVGQTNFDMKGAELFYE